MSKEPKEKKQDKKQLLEERAETRQIIGGNMNFAAAEAYKLLRTNLTFSLSGEEDACCVVGVTSSFRAEGKSVTAINLAYTLAEAQKRVLLLEGDMRLPTIARRLELNATPGLSNLLAGMCTWKECCQVYQSSTERKTVKVDVLVSGDVPPNPSELLGGQRMQLLVERLRQYYDFIIVDLPPVTAVADPIIACKIVDGMIIVVRADHTIRDAVSETVRQLRQIDARILGFVFNAAGEGGGGYYRGRRYYRKNYYRKYYKSYNYYGGYHGDYRSAQSAAEQKRNEKDHA